MAPHAPQPTIAVVEDGEKFLGLGDSWRALWSGSGDATPFNSWEFVSTWWRHFVLGRVGGATGRMRTLIVRHDDGRPAAIAPMFEEANLADPRLGTTLQPLGRANSLETMNDEPMTVWGRGQQAFASSAIGGHLRAGAFDAGWDLAVVRASVPFLETPPRPSLRWQGGSVEVERTSAGTISVALPRRWDDYRGGLSKSMRDNIAYYPRRLQREVGPFSVQIASTPAAVAAAVEPLVRLHRLRSASGYGVPHRNHIPSAQHAVFLEDALVRLARAGRVRLATLTVAGQMIAAHAFLETPGALWAYYSGFYPAWHRFSPLTIITTYMLRDAIDRGVSRLHFSPGEAPWKMRWGASQTGQTRETSIYSLRGSALLRGLIRRLRWQAATAGR